MTLVSQAHAVSFASASDHERKILREYAEFWKIPYLASPKDQEHLTLATGAASMTTGTDMPLIITPSLNDAGRVAKRFQAEVSSSRKHVTLPFARDAKVAMNVEILQFSGSEVEPLLKSGDTPLLSRIKGSRTYLLSIDLVSEYSKRVYQGLEENPSWKFRLATKLPFSYQAIPAFLRNRAFRATNSIDQLSPENLGSVEFLRTLFLASLVLASGPIPRVGFWQRGKSYSLVVTHDVETAQGLEDGAPQLLGVERDLSLRSTWNIPSDRYPIADDSFRELDGSAEIGGHDTRHDGRLVLLKEAAMIKRLRDCRDRLEKLSEKQVRGFRAPLLQHSASLLSAEAQAGYEYDSSCPSFEILSPTSMGPHGVGTLFPFEMNGVLEIPVSLPQDHQLIRVARQTPTEAVDLLLSLAKWIKSIGGPCILLIHPDYELAQKENLGEYRRLLESFAQDPECQVMTLGELNDWWRHRGEVRWDMANGHPSIMSHDQDGLSQLRTELVTGYGPDGFTVEALS